MAANKAPGCPPGELRTLKLAGMMYAKAQDEADAEALADSTLPQPPADIQAKTDSAVLAMLGAHQAKRRLKRRVTYLLRTAAVVALIACISVPLAFTADASRAAVANFLIQNFDKFSRITYDINNNAGPPIGWTSEYYPQWLPEGYSFDQIVLEDSREEIWYQDGKEYKLYFSISPQITTLDIDKENSTLYECKISSYDAILYIKEDKRTAAIAIFLPSCALYVQGLLPQEDILKIATSIHGLS